MAYTQDGRSIGIETPLGKDHLLLTAITGEEHVSRHFRFRLEMLSEDPDIAAKDIVARPVAVRIAMADGGDRWIHGFVSRFQAGWTTPQGLRCYWAEMVPWLWFLTQTTDCRIYQDLSVTGIAGQIFDQFSFSDFDASGVKEAHPSWEYRVQYRESYYNFLCRLLETEGIFYYFQHEKDRHRLVLGDSNQAFGDAPEAVVDYDESGDVKGALHGWVHDYAFMPGRWSTTDYNFAQPNAPLRSDRRTLMPIPKMADFEHFEWPGDYYTRQDGDALVMHRVQEMESRFHAVEGQSSCASFAAGLRFRLARHPSARERELKYALLSVRHDARITNYLAGDGGTFEYRNAFTALPLEANITYRPPRVAEKPRVHGPQTAVVVGPPGAKFHNDDFGRVKVQFHWDRHGQKNEKSSCWMRVTQKSSGSLDCSISVPYVGDEVIVSFLEGDPDRPIITGRVYNGLKKIPWAG